MVPGRRARTNSLRCSLDADANDLVFLDIGRQTTVVGFLGATVSMEPKDDCQTDNNLDVILVPTVGISPTGVRLGYGHGFYDKFLAEHKITTISLIMEKQIIKNMKELTKQKIIKRNYIMPTSLIRSLWLKLHLLILWYT